VARQKSLNSPVEHKQTYRGDPLRTVSGNIAHSIAVRRIVRVPFMGLIQPDIIQRLGCFH